MIFRLMASARAHCHFDLAKISPRNSRFYSLAAWPRSTRPGRRSREGVKHRFISHGRSWPASRLQPRNVIRPDDPGLLEWTRIPHDSFDAVPGCRIRTSSFCKCTLFDSPPVQQPWQAKISFIAARLVINSVLLIALPREVYLRGPGPSPDRGILDGDRVFERGRAGAGPALDEVQVLA